MAEQKTKLTDEQLAQELQKGKGSKLGGRILSLLGILIAVVGIILGGNMVLVIIGAVILGLGQMAQSKSNGKASRQAFDAIVPELVGSVLENADFSPSDHLMDADASHIPLPTHAYLSQDGYIRGTYHGLPTELCNVVLTDVNEFQREETGLWEKNEQKIYTGQWMVCETGQTLPAGLTIWPRDKLDKLLNAHTIKTGNEIFDKRFNLSCDNEQAALRFLNPSRMERFLALADGTFSKFAVSLHDDGKLYIAAHSGQTFFDLRKNRETPAQLRQRFARELNWFTEMIDTFRPI